MQPSHEDLNLLVVFEALMETRSVSKAGERLQLSQPSMSHALSKMRKAFDDPMFVRVKNEMQPTAKALEVAEPIRQALELARRQIFSKVALDLRTSSRLFTICMTDVGEMRACAQVCARVRNEGMRYATVSGRHDTAHVRLGEFLPLLPVCIPQLKRSHESQLASCL